MANIWNTESWRHYPNAQEIHYRNQVQLRDVLALLRQKPAIVKANEINALKKHLAAASDGRSFILQAGDCAESITAASPKTTQAQLTLITKLAKLLEQKLNKPVVSIARIAGQFAKPRTKTHETRAGISLLSYRGDLVNHIDFTPESREPNSARLLQGYAKAAHTYKVLKRKSSQSIYTSHEALHLHYESSFTRKVYNLSTHLPWLGMRTAQIDGAHVEYLRGIKNPIGIKVGPSTTPEQLQVLLTKLNPEHAPGRILLITRLGADKIELILPRLILAVTKLGMPVTWSCDPMHGNTFRTESGLKTRDFATIATELALAFQVHASEKSILGGIHLEITPEAVTECIGGQCGLSIQDLNQNYRTLLDPRLNASQAIELAEGLILQGF